MLFRSSASKFDLARESLSDTMTLDAKKIRSVRSLSPASSTTASDRNSAGRTTSSASDDGKSPSPDGMEDLYLISFTRCPREFRAGLLEGPLMQDCRESMRHAGLSTELETGTKIFCKPGLYTAARKAIQRFEESLRPYHVIVTEEFRPLVMQVVKAFPRALKVKCKDESVIARVGCSDEWIPLSYELNLSDCKEEEPKEVKKEESTTAKSKNKSKNTKSKNSPKAEKAASGAKDLSGALLPDAPLSLESFLSSSFPVPPMDPALAFPMLTPALPAPLEADPAFAQFVQAMEQQQAVFNHAVMLNMHAQRIFQDNLLFAAELDQQLSAQA